MDTNLQKDIIDNYPDYCAINVVANLVAGKWKIMILYHLLTIGTMRFGELKSQIDGITQKMLTSQLRELEADRLISRKVYPVVPPKVEYTPTELGVSLRPLILDMRRWGETYVQDVVEQTRR